jgi:hypothetical protein
MSSVAVVPTSAAAPSLYDSAIKALAEAKTLNEVKDISDKATAIKEYARRANDRRLEIDAAELRIKAERRLGEMLRKTPLDAGNAGKGRPKLGGRDDRPPKNDEQEAAHIPAGYVPKWNEPTLPTLAEIGITKDLSSRAQKLASISERAMEARLKTWRENAERGAERVTVNLLREPRKKADKPVPPLPSPDEEDEDRCQYKTRTEWRKAAPRLLPTKTPTQKDVWAAVKWLGDAVDTFDKDTALTYLQWVYEILDRTGTNLFTLLNISPVRPDLDAPGSSAEERKAHYATRDESQEVSQ